MNRWTRGGLALCTGFALTIAAITVADRNIASEQPPGTKLGPLNIGGYCHEEYGDRSSAVHFGVGAFGWRCWVTTNELLTSREISVDTACETMFGAPAYGDSYSLDSPFSWECFRGPRSRSSDQ